MAVEKEPPRLPVGPPIPARPVGFDEIPAGPRSLVDFADSRGWWTVALLGGCRVRVQHGTSLEDRTFTEEHEASLMVRGWKGEGQFVALYYGAESDPRLMPDTFYFWTRRHTARIRGFRPGTDEEVAWTTERPEPVKVADLGDLKALLDPEAERVYRWSDAWLAAMTEAMLAGVAEAQLAAWADGKPDLAAVRKATAKLRR